MAPYETVKTMRAAVLVLGPLVARARQASVSLPGGCAIGARPIDQHLKGLEAMGVKITLNQGYVEAKAKRLHGADITLDLPTVTGTENLMMAATLAKGTTRLVNAAQEPEVTDLARFLTAMGAQIEGIGTDVLTIHGVQELKPASYTIMSDRIEAGTYLAAAAITKGQVTITNAPVSYMAAVLEKFHEAGVRLSTTDDRIMVEPGGSLIGVDVKTHPYPGFPTDMQAQFMALMSLAKGASVITETIFENRYMHVSELKRLGADINVNGNLAVVRGRRQLQGAPVMATTCAPAPPWSSPAWPRPAPPKSSGSTTWTGATPAWWKNSRPWGRGLRGKRPDFLGEGAKGGQPLPLSRNSCPSQPLTGGWEGSLRGGGSLTYKKSPGLPSKFQPINS